MKDAAGIFLMYGAEVGVEKDVRDKVEQALAGSRVELVECAPYGHPPHDEEDTHLFLGVELGRVDATETSEVGGEVLYEELGTGQEFAFKVQHALEQWTEAKAKLSDILVSTVLDAPKVLLVCALDYD